MNAIAATCTTSSNLVRRHRSAATPLDSRQLEQRVGARLVAALSVQSEQLAPDIEERLRFARKQALERARAARATAGAGQFLAHSSGTAVVAWGGQTPLWQRAASLLPLLMLLAGLVAINYWSAREQVVAVADVDVQLLADTLPPAAYSDPGFGAYLRSAPLP